MLKILTEYKNTNDEFLNIYENDFCQLLEKTNNFFDLSFNKEKNKNEIEFFTKYKIIDSITLYNNLLLSELTSFLLNPHNLTYKINIFSPSADITNLLLTKLTNVEFNYNINHNIKLIYQQNIIKQNKNLIDFEQTHFNLYTIKCNKVNSIYEKNKEIINNCSPEKIIEQINNNISNLNEFLIEKYCQEDEDNTNSIFVHFIFNSFVLPEEIKENDFSEMSNNYINEFNSIDTETIKISDSITNSYFKLNNHIIKSYISNSYCKNYITNKRLINNLNYNILFLPEEQLNNNEQDINKINFLFDKYFISNPSFKDVPTNNNLIVRINKSYLESFPQSIIYLIKSNYIKNIFYYIKSLNRYNRLISDNLGLYIEKQFVITSKDLADKYVETFSDLMSSRYSEYKEQVNKLKEDFISSITENFHTSLSKITSLKDEVYLASDSDIQKITNDFKEILQTIKSMSENFIKEMTELNDNFIFYIKDKLKEHGIISQKFNDLLYKIDDDFKIQSNINALLVSNESEIQEIATKFGVSSAMGLFTGGVVFALSRLGTYVGSNMIAGIFGGPAGVIMGAVVGIGTFIGQSVQFYKNKKKKIGDIYVDLKNSSEMVIELLKEKIKIIYEKNEKIMEDVYEYEKQYIGIILNHSMILKKDL